MTEQEVLDLINAWIVANGNNEITADVLRPVLIAILQQPNDLIGDLSTLNTTDQSNLVSAINEIYNSLNNNTGIQLYEGLDDPNDTPPTTYNIADFYIQKDISNNPIQLWQYNGVVWKRVGDIYLESTAYQETRFDYVGSNSFTIPENVQAIIVKKNGNPTESKLDWNQLGNVVTYVHAMETDDFLLISGIYVNEVSGGGGVGATTFLGLTDTPSTYIGQAGKFPKVNAGENGLEFDDVGGSQSFEDVLQVNRTSTTSPLIPNATEPTGAVNLQQLDLKLTKVSTGSQERVYGVGVDNVQKMISTKEQFVSDADIITALNAITSTVATISVVGKTMYKGQMYVSTSPDYLYVAFDDNLIIRK